MRKSGPSVADQIAAIEKRVSAIERSIQPPASPSNGSVFNLPEIAAAIENNRVRIKSWVNNLMENKHGN